MIYVIDRKYTPAVISPALFSKNFTFTDNFSVKASCGKSSIPRYLNLPLNSNN